MYPTQLLKASERKVRITWLVLVSLYYALAYTFIGIKISEPKIMEPTTAAAVGVIFAYCLILGYVGVFFYSLYYCAYENTGTKLLSCQAVCFFLRPILFFSGTTDSNTVVDWAIFAGDFFLCSALAYFCIQVRKINLRIKQEALLA